MKTKKEIKMKKDTKILNNVNSEKEFMSLAMKIGGKPIKISFGTDEHINFLDEMLEEKDEGEINENLRIFIGNMSLDEHSVTRNRK